jgi:hypothetical protein
MPRRLLFPPRRNTVRACLPARREALGGVLAFEVAARELNLADACATTPLEPSPPSGRAAPRLPSCSSVPCAWLCSSTMPGAIRCSYTPLATSSSSRVLTACLATSYPRCPARSAARWSATGPRCWPRLSDGSSLLCFRVGDQLSPPSVLRPLRQTASSGRGRLRCRGLGPLHLPLLWALPSRGPLRVRPHGPPQPLRGQGSC